MSLELVTNDGQGLRLGRELARGGEGTVFEVAGSSELVAKIYHEKPSLLRSEKLFAMATSSSDGLRRISAWPLKTLHERNSTVRGFVMERVSNQRDIHLLYGPKTRLREFPDKSYRFLTHVAANLARAFAVVHQHGHAIGDVNQGGVCVSAQGTVTLVDCDSFQISSGSRDFSCDVGIPIYQPPELQSVRTFRGLHREANHDLFGLAVLVFQTLFLARHPFAGAFLGDGEMPIERAIREYRFAYARDAGRRQMKQPPATLGLGTVPAALAMLFERAFLEEGSRQARPSALEWVAALEAFANELIDCPQNKGHSHLRTLQSCPLCALESRTGTLLFLPPQSSSTVSTPTVKLDEVWRGIVNLVEGSRLPSADELRRMPQPALSPSPEIVQYVRRKQHARNILLWGIAASVLERRTG